MNEAIIRLPPSVNQCWYNVPKRGRKNTPVYEAWATAAGWEMKIARPVKVSGPYFLEILVHPGMPGDIDNRIKPISDLLVKLDLVDDDKHAQSVTIRRSDLASPEKAIVRWGKA